MMPEFDVAVIGGGIVGLAHTWMAARRGLRVLLLERTSVAQGASVRNFGMIWPIGQPAGELHALALRSRALWLELKSQGVLDVEECGSLHLAHRPDELAVLEEFCAQRTHDVRMLTPSETAAASEFANPDGLLGGMFSPTELRVDPRTASARIAGWLAESCGVTCCFNTLVVNIEGDAIRAADGRSWRAGRIVVCSGADLQTLLPDVLQASGLRLCKLQMLRSVPQPPGRSDHPAVHLASGLTLRHYAAFQGCPSLATLRARVATETPELERYGIHVMASTFAGGEVTLGDSHEYGEEITPFNKTLIDDLILREARHVFRLPDWAIAERWSGVYAKHPQLPVFEAQAGDGTRVFVGAGGAGMTMSFGLAERAWKQWEGNAG